MHTYPNVFLSEKELSIEIRFLNGVHIGHVNASFRSAADAHHRPVFQNFTTNRTGAHLPDKNNKREC